jgi:hypothetical protein
MTFKRIALALTLWLAGCGGSSAPQRGDPYLAFSDLTSGPRTGNSDTSAGQNANEDGAFVTVWGMNLGTAQGSSKVTCNGADARVLYWGPAKSPFSPASLDNPYVARQVVIFQVSHLAQDGDGQIVLEVGGRNSNPLPFTVRAGNLLFARNGGNDSSGDGSWNNSFASIVALKDALQAGDIGYAGDGLSATTEDNYGGAVNLNASGTVGVPKALVAYPGATVQIGNPNLRFALSPWSTSEGGYVENWTLAKLHLVASETVAVRAIAS